MPGRFKGLKILDQIHDAIIASDLDGIISSWNNGAERLYGYSAAEAVGANICMLHFPDDRPCIQSSVFDLLHDTDMVEIELRNRHKSGEEIFVDSRISGLRDSKGRLVGFLSCSNNITVRVKAENALRSSREQLWHLVSSTPGFLYSCAIPRNWFLETVTGHQRLSGIVRISPKPSESRKPGASRRNYRQWSTPSLPRWTGSGGESRENCTTTSIRNWRLC
jgi:PAS domain S-box-containing protein